MDKELELKTKEFIRQIRLTELDMFKNPWFRSFGRGAFGNRYNWIAL